MTDLRPCPACDRHVRLDETSCPFCAAALAAAPAPSLPVGRLTRAAVFAAGAALAAGCGSSPPKTEGPNQGQEMTADAGAQAAPTPDAPAAATPIPDHATPMPYGAPPARDRLV